MTNDMTKGNPVKLILFFSIPLLIGNIFQQFYSMVDTIIVGRFIGVEALAAVGSTGAMVFLVNGFVMGLASGFAILVAQRFGAKDEIGMKKAVASAITLSVISVIIITLISVFTARPMLNLMNTPSDIMEDASKYIIIIYAGTIATFIYNLISSILRSLGDSKTPLYFLIVSSILNIVLDIIFIVNFSMGVAGAAYATVISQGVSGILCLIYTYKKHTILKLKKSHFIVTKDYYITHLKIGIPMALQFSVTAIGIMIVQAALNIFGSTVIAAYTAASKALQLVMQPAITFGVTMATYCGQNLGAKNYKRIKEGVKKCTKISIITSIIAGAILILFGKYFVMLFITNPDASIIGYATQCLNIAAIFFIPLGLIFIYRNALQGIGDSFVPMMAGVYELTARSLVAFILPKYIGYLGICLADPVAWIAAAAPLAYTYFKRIKELLNEHPEEDDNDDDPLLEEAI